MSYRSLYELLIALAMLAVAWNFIVKPAFRLWTRPRRKALTTLDDLTGPTTAGEVLAEAKRGLADRRALEQAAELNKQPTPRSTT